MGYQRKQEDNRRLGKLYEDVFAHQRWMLSGVSSWGGYYHKIYRGRRSKWFKRECNKRLRHMDDVADNGYYKKCTEFWWAIW